MSAKRVVPISAPATGEEEWLALREPLDSGWLTQGAKVAAFERELAARCGVRHGVATTSCTTGLHLTLAALDIGPGDEVIVPSFTWVATANAVLTAGATPVLVDVDAVTYNVDPAAVARALTPRTRAVFAVHLFGLCADMDALASAAPGVLLLEDAACAAGASYHGRPAGALGRAAVFSFHPRKSITTGEGGMLVTSDDALAARARSLRNHGASPPAAGAAPFTLPAFDELGWNYRMTDLQAAIGLVQLGKLDRLRAEREAMATHYQRELAAVPWLRTPVVPPGYRHGWQSYVCFVDPARAPRPRDAIMAALEERGIGCRPGTHAVHALGHIRDRFGIQPEALPVALACERQTLAIPLHNRMSEDDVVYVIDALRAIR